MTGAPRTTLADEATIARAQAMSERGDHAAAVDALLAFVASSADGLAADRALYRAATIVDEALVDRARALELYLRLVTEYPRSHHAAAARARLRDLRNG